MASIAKEENGNRRILFVAPDGSRKTVRLGKVSQRAAEGVKLRVEQLLECLRLGQPMTADLAEWITALDAVLAKRLANVGLIAPREPKTAVTMDAFLTGYLAERGDLKASTLTVMQQARIWLVRFMGEAKRLDEVSTGDADAYKADMVASKLAKATIAKRCRYARHFFAVAMRRKLIRENPFAHITGAVKGDSTRRLFVPAETVAKVLEVLPDYQWRLLVALARWGGLRIPSEAVALRWQDVDLPGRRFIVRASKTEHHEDGGIRVVPMFPELVPHFEEAWERAEEGATLVLPRFTSAANTRTMFVRYIAKAGIKPWGKPWQNLRVSRATELADQYPSHVCAAWLGHTEKVADAFYRQVTDSHFSKAVEGSVEAAQNPAQYMQEMGCNKPQAKRSAHEKTPVLQGFAASCMSVQNASLGGTGFEPVTPTV